ncbi:MAG: recombination mediator RecR [Saprospiraceae bacterium]|jgi:recombination protein RecR
MHFSSQLIEQAVDAFAALPGIGRKTALRLVLHLVNEDLPVAENLGAAVLKMRREIQFCQQCHNISDQDLCHLCMDPRRDGTTICVVEHIRDVMAIEDTGQFRGLYHVLGGIINPLEGIGPDALHIDSLVQRVQQNGVSELIMAISPTIEGETTMFYIARQLKDKAVKMSVIARGVSFGGELQYADEMTLGRSIAGRTTYSAP